MLSGQSSKSRGRILGERGLRVDDGREGIEIDEHRLGGIDGLAKRLGDHHRHGFADEPDRSRASGQRAKASPTLTKPWAGARSRSAPV